MMLHTHNLSSLKAEAGGSLQIPGQPGLHSDTLFQNSVNQSINKNEKFHYLHYILVCSPAQLLFREGGQAKSKSSWQLLCMEESCPCIWASGRIAASSGRCSGCSSGRRPSPCHRHTAASRTSCPCQLQVEEGQLSACSLLGQSRCCGPCPVTLMLPAQYESDFLHTTAHFLAARLVPGERTE